MKFVTLDQASQHLRRDTDFDNADLELKIEAATEICAGYLKKGMDQFTDSSGEVPLDSNGVAINIPRQIQSACLLMIGYLYDDRGPNEKTQWELGYLPRPVMGLLYRFRDPALA